MKERIKKSFRLAKLISFFLFKLRLTLGEQAVHLSKARLTGRTLSNLDKNPRICKGTDTQKCHVISKTALPKLCKRHLSKETRPTRTLMVVSVCWLQRAFLLELTWQALCFGYTGPFTCRLISWPIETQLHLQFKLLASNSQMQKKRNHDNSEQENAIKCTLQLFAAQQFSKQKGAYHFFSCCLMLTSSV